MRWVFALLYAFSTLCIAAERPPGGAHTPPRLADVNAAAGQSFNGDRIVIFEDDSAAFAAFAENVLRDPEVANFMNQNFAVYTVETGSPEAAALPYFGGTRLDPRVIATAPRLDDLTLFFFPSTDKARFLSTLRAMKQAQTMQEFRTAMGGFAGPTAENMTAWAREFYPAMTEPGAAPDGLLVGFLISRDMKVLNHSAAIARRGVSMLQELRRMFPPASVPDRADSGASCFGGTNPKEAKYCVTWALIAK